MYILDLPTRSMQILLGGAVVATESSWTVHYKQISKSGEETMALGAGATSGTTPVTMIAAPQAGDRVAVDSIAIHNADSGSVTVTIRLNDNGTARTIYKATLATLETLVYDDGAGWLAYTTAGAIK